MVGENGLGVWDVNENGDRGQQRERMRLWNLAAE